MNGLPHLLLLELFEHPCLIPVLRSLLHVPTLLSSLFLHCHLSKIKVKCLKKMLLKSSPSQLFCLLTKWDHVICSVS